MANKEWAYTEEIEIKDRNDVSKKLNALRRRLWTEFMDNYEGRKVKIRVEVVK